MKVTGDSDQGRHRRRVGEPRTLAEVLCPLGDEALHRELEEYRVQYEREWGATDLTKTYTTMWPRRLRDWLLRTNPKAFWDGMAPFCKAYFRGKTKIAAREGELDTIPDSFIELFVRGNMKLDIDESEIGGWEDISR